MAKNSAGENTWLKDRTATLFLAAGALFILAAVNNSLPFFTDGYEPAALSTLLLLAGLLVAVLGLGGMYAPLHERTSRLAQLGLAAVGLAGMSVLVLLVWVRGTAAGLTSEVPMVIALAALVLFVLGFALFGVSVLNWTVYPHLAGLLLLAEAVALLMVFVVPPVVYGGEPPRVFGVGIEALQALLLLGIGYSIRQAEVGVDRREPAPWRTV